MQREAVERQVTGPGRLTKGSDLWLTGARSRTCGPSSRISGVRRVGRAMRCPGCHGLCGTWHCPPALYGKRRFREMMCRRLWEANVRW
jgi:hypothetical protein